MTPTVDLDRAFADTTGIMDAFREAFHGAVREYRRNDNAPMVFWQDGKVVEIPADQVPLPEDNNSD